MTAMVQIGGGRSTVPAVEARLDVMIVEDEPISRRALQELVTAHGFACRSFPSAEDALRAVDVDGVPNVVLVDFHLPGMNGIEFIRHVEQANSAVLPVLITAAGNDTLDQIRRACPVPCLRKPLDFSRLLSLLNARATTN